MGAIGAGGRPGVATLGGASIPGMAVMASGFAGDAAGAGIAAMVSDGLVVGAVGGEEGATFTPDLGVTSRGMAAGCAAGRGGAGARFVTGGGLGARLAAGGPAGAAIGMPGIGCAVAAAPAVIAQVNAIAGRAISVNELQ